MVSDTVRLRHLRSDSVCARSDKNTLNLAQDSGKTAAHDDSFVCLHFARGKCNEVAHAQHARVC